MSKAFTEIDMVPIQRAFERPEELPEIYPGPVGRIRLVEALRGRYGDNYRIIKVARDALKHFDDETAQVKGYLEAKYKIKGEV